MKKFLSLLIAMMLLCTVALADTESKTTDDFTSASPSTSGYTGAESEEDGFEIYLDFLLEESNYAEHKSVYEAELAKLAAAESKKAYFGEAASAIEGVLGEGEVAVHEFVPVIVKNYDVQKHGDVTTILNFATPYAKGDKVAVMIGLVNFAQDGSYTINWNTYTGTVVDEGSIEVKLDSAILSAIQSGMALLAVVSK